MVRPELLTIIVLGLTLFVYTSAQHLLETGYDYTNTHTIENDQLREDLKCGYLFGWYTHMRVIKLLFEKPYNTELRALVGHISSTNSVVKLQIISLFGLKGKRIGAMWPLYLFTGFIYKFYDKTGDRPKIAETLVYVIDKLDADLAGCREENSFDSYDSTLESLQTYGSEHYIKTIFAVHLEKAKGQLRKNVIFRDDLLIQRLEINNNIANLFLNNLGQHKKLLREFQNVYNLRMNWNNTSTVLHMAWLKARRLDWTNTNLYPIILYYNACYDFFKIIIARLTLKHLAYLMDCPIDSDAFLHYAQKWYLIVVQFGTILRLSDDLHVDRLLNILRNLIYGTQTLASVVRILVTILITLCQPFGCDAGNEFVIDNQEFTIPYKSLIGEQLNSLNKTATTAMGIEYNSLKNARNFLSHLELAFNTVNFSIIRSLTEYIYELNLKKGVIKPEDCTEELEKFFDMSDYD